MLEATPGGGSASDDVFSTAYMPPTGSDLSSGVSPSRSGENLFQHLPAQLTSLIGREKEIEAVCALLQRKEVRLLTLSGTGGIGKTRLGIEVASRLSESFADGIVFVPLAPIIHPRLVLSTIKHALGLEQSIRDQGTRHLDDLKAFLRNRHLLLVLDNFEQVLPAAPDLVDLLLACPHLKLLVTSRAVLHVQGEYEFVVPPLALPRWTHLPAIDVLAQYASVAMFIERALAIKPDLPLTMANMQAIASICVHLDGIPLAIELAAARVKLLPLPGLFRQLSQTHRLDILTGGSRDLPERQQTLRNTLTWSYNLLNQTEQHIFRLISIFVGGCTLDAIEAVSHAVTGKVLPVLDILASLLDKSLLGQAEQEGEEARFVMLETVREYGLDCLHSNGEDETAWQALATYFLTLAEQAEPQYTGSEQITWLQRLDREHENIRAVLLWMLMQGEAGHSMTMALRLGAALRNFWVIRGPFREGRIFLERALTIREGVEIAIQAKATSAAANLALLQGDFDAAEALGQESLKLFRELDDHAGIANALYLLAWVARDDIAIDRALAENALALFEDMGDREMVAWSVYTLAYLDTLRGEYQSAFKLNSESLALHRVAGNTRGIAHSLLNMAELHVLTHDDLAIASAYLDESLPLLKDLDDQDGQAHANNLQGLVALQQGDAGQARSRFEETLALYMKLESQQGILHTYHFIARAATARGDYETASAFHRESLAIARELKMKEWVAASLEGLAAVAAWQVNCPWAVCLWGKAEALRETVHIPIPLNERTDYDQAVSNTRVRLGENRFAALWTQGHAMTLEQVLALQGQEIAPPPAPSITPPASIYPAGLTEREVRVLRLVAQGLTNMEIAAELNLSEKTIAHHLTHIFNKTTTENRAGAVAFAYRHGLV